MITMRLGKLFCQVYNEKERTAKNLPPLSPKEIFCDVIAPLVFDNDTSKWLFDVYNTRFSGATSKTMPYDERLRLFINDVETDYGIMTFWNCYGGCANVVKKEEKKTKISYTSLYPITEHCISDIIYFNIDERYCSFIGAPFMLKLKSYAIVVLSPEYVWDVYCSLKKYKQLLTTQVLTKGGQSGTWNLMYLTKTVINACDYPNFDDIIEISDGKYIINASYSTIYNLLQIIFHYDVKFIDVEKFDKQNTSMSTIFVDIEPLKRRQRLFQSLMVNGDDKYFDHSKYSKLFGNEIFNSFVYTGKISENVYDPKLEWIKNDIPNIVKYVEQMAKPKIRELVQLTQELFDDLRAMKKVTPRPNNKIKKAKETKNFDDFMKIIVELKTDYGNNDKYEQITDIAIDDSRTKEDFTEFQILLNIKDK